VAELELILVLLAAAVALQVMAARFGIPQPALLVVGGAVLALVPGLPRPALDPQVIFLIFVPPLLYQASIRAPLRELGQQFWPILHLSVPLVLLTMVAVAITVHALSPEVTWPAAFVLGAIVAPPDPVAAVAVMRPLRAPAALSAVLEGEGMFNDATALVAYRIAVAAAVTGVFSLWRATVEFAWSGALGVLVGLLVARGALAIRRQVQNLPLVDNSISLLTPFAAYVPADALGGSGVLAVVAAGLYVGQHLATVLSPAARLQTTMTWGMVGFILENLVFILIGLELPHLIGDTQAPALGAWLGFGAVVSLVVILVRLATVLPSPFIWRAFTGKRAAQHGIRNVALVGWIGVRGADSVVIALALPHLTTAGGAFPARGLIIFITFVVVFATLVLQGLSIGPLTRWFDLQGDTQSDREEAHARHVVAAEGLRRLEELAESTGSSPGVLDELRHRHKRRIRRWAAREQQLGGALIGPHEPDDGGDDGGDSAQFSYRRLRAAMIDAERHAVVELRDRGVIGADALRRIERDLDLEAVLLEEPAETGRRPPPGRTQQSSAEAPRSGEHRATSAPLGRE
jgi:CPA1 family monovalent cation:H+ antiporter